MLWLWYIVVIGGLVALCALAVWAVLFTASRVRQREREICAGTAGNDDVGGASSSAVHAYSLKVDPYVDARQRQRMELPNDLELSVLARCKGTKVALMTARVDPHGLTWLPLIQTRESIRLHHDIVVGRVRNLLIRGIVVRTWAKKDTLSAIIIGRLPSDDQALLLPKGCSALPIATPFHAQKQSASAWNDLVRGLVPDRAGEPVLLSVWGF